MLRLYYAQPHTGLGQVQTQLQVCPVHGIVHGLGQQPSPTLDTIKRLSREFPKCFDSRSILPSIDTSIAFAGTITTEGLSRWGGDASPEATKKHIDDDIASLKWWRNRLSTEPVAVYCADLTRQEKPAPNAPADAKPPQKVKSNDWQLIENAIIGPYQRLYGIEGARATVEAASAELLKNLLDGLRNPLTPLLKVMPTWVYVVGIGLAAVVAAGLYARVRGPRKE